MKIGKNGNAHFFDDETALKPTHDILKNLKLKIGLNKGLFTIKTFFGIYSLETDIYLWELDSKIVISDIDGTITRSDALGQILPLFGIEYLQTGVVSLLSEINDNNYKIIYLTARPLIEASYTKKYLRSAEQSK